MWKIVQVVQNFFEEYAYRTMNRFWQTVLAGYRPKSDGPKKLNSLKSD